MHSLKLKLGSENELRSKTRVMDGPFEPFVLKVTDFKPVVFELTSPCSQERKSK